MSDGPIAAPFQIKRARGKHELGAVRDLFAAYAASLPVDLDYQDFAAEVADLPGKYAPPGGEILVAWDAARRPIACIGLRPLDAPGTCEMKRLYVVPEARSFGLGKALTEALIEVAKSRGYAALRLDTLPTMHTAASLYERLGFRRIKPYYAPTPEGTMFMELDLSPSSGKHEGVRQLQSLFPSQ
jgi:ribosomal protein S18 acetylase RimI-like enzyme